MHRTSGGIHLLQLPVPDGSRSFQSVSPDLDRVADLFRAHFGFVRRVLMRCGVPEPELDDAVQETFMVVHRKIDDFDGRAAETTWLYAIAVRVASTMRRASRREVARREKAGLQMHAASTVDPEQEVGRTQANALLDQLLEQLDQTKRTVFVLAELEGVPVPEIAKIMDANVRTTHSRLRLARERFNAALDRHHAQESGRAQRASLSTLARRTAVKPPSEARTRRAWAALAVRISQGAGPTVGLATGGTSATLAAKASGFVLPFALTVGLGAVVLGGASSLWPPSDAGVATGSTSARKGAGPSNAVASPKVAKELEAANAPESLEATKEPQAANAPELSEAASAGDNTAAVLDDALAERGGSTLTGDDAAAVLDDALAEREGSTLTGDDAAVEREGSTLRGEGSTLRGEGSTLRGEGSTLRGEGSTLTRDDAAAQPDSSTLTRDDAAAQPDSSTLTRDDAAAQPDSSMLARDPSSSGSSSDAREGPASASVQPDDLDAETRLLQRARTELRGGDTDAALRLLRQHQVQFPNGLLAAERDATRIKALCKAGLDARAREHAGEDSALLAVLSASCEE